MPHIVGGSAMERVNCKTCHGNGRVVVAVCQACGGSGMITPSDKTAARYKCDRCYKGRITKFCNDCNGTGWAPGSGGPSRGMLNCRHETASDTDESCPLCNGNLDPRKREWRIDMYASGNESHGVMLTPQDIREALRRRAKR